MPRAVVHVDLDGAGSIFRVHGWPVPRASDELFLTGLAGALETFARWGIRATLFVIVTDLDDPYKRASLDEAVRLGHEIASHTVSHRPLTELTPAEQRREILDSRLVLEDRLGVRVEGFRAPGFAIDHDCLHLVGEAGYRYDSSMFRGSRLARSATHPSGAALPRVATDGDLVELPLPSYRPLPLPYHPSYSLVLGRWYFRAGFARQAAADAPFTLLFHLTDFSDPVSREWNLGWRSRLFTLSHLTARTKQRKCDEILRIVSRKFELSSTTTLLDEHAQ